MARYWRKLALLGKMETTYGTDSSPTGAANAIQAIDARLTPIEAQEISRELLFPYLGHQGVMLTGEHASLEYSVECTGSGVKGTPPKYGPLLRACGLKETVVANTSVTYTPVSAAYESASQYYNRDGVNNILLGSRGSVTLDMTPTQIPRWRFTFKGLIGTVADVALPVADYSGYIKPVEISKANTTISLHGLALIAERFSFDLGNQVEARLLVGYEGIEIVDRQATGSVVAEAVALAQKNWISIARAETTGALSLTHGTIAGNIMTMTAPAVQIGRPTEGNTQKIVNNTLPLMFTPNTGNDEFSIVFT